MNGSGQNEILLVDDNSNEIELILWILKKCKFENKVFAAEDGICALKYIYTLLEDKEKSIDLPKVIFLDLNMPRIQGIEVLKKFKSDDRLKHIPIVILTSSQDEEDMKECYAAGANSYVIKPVEYSLFVEYINKLVLYWVCCNKLP